jgi:hypothetical protein
MSSRRGLRIVWISLLLSLVPWVFLFTGQLSYKREETPDPYARKVARLREKFRDAAEKRFLDGYYFWIQFIERHGDLKHGDMAKLISEEREIVRRVWIPAQEQFFFENCTPSQIRVWITNRST